MRRLGGRIVSWCLTVLMGMWGAAASADEPLAKWLPPGAIGSLEVANTAALLARIEQSDLLQKVVDSAEYRKWADSPDGRKFRGGRAVLEGQLGMNTWEAGKRILGHQALAALYPPAENSKKPQAILLIHLADAEIGPHLRKQFEPWTDVLSEQLTAEDRDDGWYLTAKDGTTACLTGQWLAAATSAELLQQVRTRLASKSGDSLADSPLWSGPPAPLDSENCRVNVRIDLEQLRRTTGQSRLLPDKLDNPLASLLVGAMVEAIARGTSINATATVSPDGFNVQVRTAAPLADLGAGQQALLATLPAASDLTPAVPRQLAGFTLCREWSRWYQSREELLIDRVLPEFDKFETGLSNFLPGKDFAQDVLGLLNAPLSIVVAGQTYSHLTARPGMQLPAFAVVLDLRDPQQGADVFRLFFQTLATILNIEAGKQGRQPWVMDSETYHGVQVSFARYLELPQGEELPLVFNFQPASALVGNRFVAASSVELCRDLVDALQPEIRPAVAGPPPPARNWELSLDPKTAADLLLANRAVLTAKGVQSGKPIEQAEAELDFVVELLRRWSPVRTAANVQADGLELTIQGAWK